MEFITREIGASEKQALWDNFENHRHKFDRLGRSLIRSALMEQFAQVEKRAQARGRVGTIFNLTTDSMTKAYTALYTIVGSDFAKRTVENFGTSFTEQHAQIIESTMQRYVLRELSGRIDGVTSNTKGIIQKLFEEEETKKSKKGLIDELIKKVRKAFTKLIKRRAKGIADTEIVTASNSGSLAGAMSIHQPAKKIWLTRRDDRVRPFHESADSQKRDLNQPFDVGGENLMFPGDPAGSLANTIGCRCALLYG